MFKKVWVITWAGKTGKLHCIPYDTKEGAEKRAEWLMDKTDRDGIERDWIIREFYVKCH